MMLPKILPDILISFVLPLALVLFVMILKNWKNIKRSTGIDFIIVAILFDIVVLYSPDKFKEDLASFLKDYFVSIFISLIILEFFILLYCIFVEKKLQNRYNSIVINNLITTRQLDTPMEDIKYKISLGLFEYSSWMFVAGFVGFNIFIFILT